MFVQPQDQEDQEDQRNLRSLESASVPCNFCFFARKHAPLLKLLLCSRLYRITKDNAVNAVILAAVLCGLCAHCWGWGPGSCCFNFGVDRFGYFIARLCFVNRCDLLSSDDCSTGQQVTYCSSVCYHR